MKVSQNTGLEIYTLSTAGFLSDGYVVSNKMARLHKEKEIFTF